MMKKRIKTCLLTLIVFSLLLSFSLVSAKTTASGWFNSSGDNQNINFLTTGLRSGYKLDDLGDNVLDRVRGQNGTNGTGLIKGDTGILNYSYNFEKSTSEKITLPAPYDDEERTSYSFSIWFYWTQKNETEDWMRVLNDQSNYMQLMFINSTKQLEFNPQGASIYTGVNSIPTNSWVNVILVCKDEGYHNGNFSIWINGNLNVSTYTGASCTVGGSGRPIDIVPSSWGGKVDEIYFWNRTLNNTEVGYVSNGITFDFYDIPEVPPALTIPEIYPISAVTLNGGTTKTLVVQFNATDTNGYTDLNYSTANANVTSGITFRNSNICINTANYSSTNTSTITCNITMNFYDEAGNYNISVGIKDNSGNGTINATNNFFVVNALDYLTQNLNYINFTNLYVGTNDNEAGNIITITNGGNQNYNNFSIMARNLTGQIYSDKISATQFSVSNLTGQTTGQTYLLDSHYKSVPIFNFNRHGSSISETIYFYIDMPTGLRADKYLSDASWSLKLENN